MKRNFLALTLIALTALASACGGSEDDFNNELEELYNAYNGGGGGGGGNDNFWSSDASDSAGNFDSNGEGYVCVDGVCY